MKSKKALFAHLEKTYGKKVDLESDGIGDETYGRVSMIYVYDWKIFHTTREAAERDLEANGFKVHKDWSKGGPGSEIQVSYFKGYHWDE